jgi:hypothetical protein
MARLPNKGLALKHDLAERSTVIVSRFEYYILPESDFEILCSYPIRIVRRRSECYRKIAESDVKKVLERDVNPREEEPGEVTGGDTHLELGGDVEFYGKYSCYGECKHEIPGILFPIHQSDVARKKSITHALKYC